MRIFDQHALLLIFGKLYGFNTRIFLERKEISRRRLIKLIKLIFTVSLVGLRPLLVNIPYHTILIKQKKPF